MPHHADRPTKTCACCGRPFQWRRKWKEVWAEVRYCSDRCRNLARRPGERRRAKAPDTSDPAAEGPRERITQRRDSQA